MNDRFKFRVFNTMTNKYIQEENLYRFFIDTDGKLYYLGDYNNIIEVKEDDFILEQCTGLKDENGNLIYEGDIITRKGMYRRVFWIDDEGGFGYEPATLFESLQTKTCEIVGNIHENPGLLEQSNE